MSDRADLINAHEHLASERELGAYARAAETIGIARTILVGSPEVTLTQDPAAGFDGYEANNRVILAVARRVPGRYLAFPTLHPLDADNLGRLEAYLAAGASGIKLYYGESAEHGRGPFHVIRLDDRRMDPVLARAQALDLPIIFHVNRVRFYAELLGFLARWPRLKVCLPHLMVSVKTPHRLSRVAAILDTYPRVVSDLSFGREDHLLPVAEAMAGRRDEFRAFVRRYADRLMFGTDAVVSPGLLAEPGDTLGTLYRWDRSLLEDDRYEVQFSDRRVTLRGLRLDPATLDRVYVRTAETFLASGAPDRSSVGSSEPEPAYEPSPVARVVSTSPVSAEEPLAGHPI